MTNATSLAIGSAVLLSTFAVATAMDSFYRVEIRPRPPDPLTSATGSALGIPLVPTRQPLTLRLVDSGGVGIPAGDWGADYSHDARVFREAILSIASFDRSGVAR
jgi:hypothetical protein